MCGDVQSEEPVKLRQKEAELIDVIDVACGRLSYAASKRDYRLFYPRGLQIQVPSGTAALDLSPTSPAIPFTRHFRQQTQQATGPGTFES